MNESQICIRYIMTEYFDTERNTFIYINAFIFYLILLHKDTWIGDITLIATGTLLIEYFKYTQCLKLPNEEIILGMKIGKPIVIYIFLAFLISLSIAYLYTYIYYIYLYFNYMIEIFIPYQASDINQH